MAFTRVSTLSGEQYPFEYYLLTDNEAATIGEAFVQTNGRLTKCAATATPEFIAVCSRTAENPSVTPLPVYRMVEDMILQTTSIATVAPTLVGNKVTLNTDGLTVTATTASGVFEITATDGATTNSTVQGMFRR